MFILSNSKGTNTKIFNGEYSMAVDEFRNATWEVRGLTNLSEEQDAFFEWCCNTITQDNTYITEYKAHELATICTRYANLKNAAKTARMAAYAFKTASFITTLSDHELRIVDEFSKIAGRVEDNSNQHDAVKYFKSINDGENNKKF